MLIVQKYGGSSVADVERVYNVAKRVIATYEQGHDVVVVLSAQGKTTDQLIAKAKEYSEHPCKRELDMLLTCGEQMSVALMSMAIQQLGYPAVSLNSYQVGMTASNVYGNARIESIGQERIKAELERKNIVVITGFQGINDYQDITTLGRGGSDTTAVALAAALNADLCEIYTDVDGVYTADPRVVPSARKLEEISYDEMLELAAKGAKVLHSRSVELAKKYNVELVVRSSLNLEEGTIVREVANMEKMLVSGVAGDRNIARISIIRVEDRPGKAFQIFSLLEKHNISVDIILQATGSDGLKDISFTVKKDDLHAAMKVLEENKEILGAEEIQSDADVAKVSIVGAGMASHFGVASKMFEILFDANINVDMISTSEITISVLVSEADLERAMQVVHEGFELDIVKG